MANLGKKKKTHSPPTLPANSEFSVIKIQMGRDHTWDWIHTLEFMSKMNLEKLSNFSGPLFAQV